MPTKDAGRSHPAPEIQAGLPPNHAPSALERAQMAREAYRREQGITQAAVAGSHPGAVADFIGGIGQHPLTTFRDVTGIDVHRFYHPLRSIQQDRSRAAALGRQGKLGSIGIFPGGGTKGGLERLLGRLVGRAAPEVVAEGKQLASEAARPGEVAALTPAEKVRESLPTAKKLRVKQKKAGSEELSKRVARMEQASAEAGGGIAGHHAGLGELKGEMPKTTFENLREGNLSQDNLDSLFRDVQAHPGLLPLQKVTAMKALGDAFEHGRTPAPHEIALLHEVFGPEAADQMISLRSRIGGHAMDALNVPRSLMASMDASGTLRQGLLAAAGHPRLFVKNLVPQIKAIGSEKYYQAQIAEIHARPNYPLYEPSHLRLTELKGKTSLAREEQFSSDLAEKIPIMGRIVRASGRGYTLFLDKVRADIFDSMLQTAQQKGAIRTVLGNTKEIDTESQKFLRSLGEYASSATGRGGLKPFGMNLESAAPVLNTVFFAPRLIASRLNFFDPTWYFRLDPFVRRQALKSMLTLGSGSALALAIAGEYVGAKVGLDPRNADFAKLRFDNTRIDILGGMQQYIRLATQLSTGEIVSSTTGKTLHLGSSFGALSRADILWRFIEGKYSPPASFVNDFLKGTAFAGQPFDVKKELVQRIVPLVAQDAYDLQKDQGSIPLTAGGYALSALGVGMQTYAAPNQSKAAVEAAQKWAARFETAFGQKPPHEIAQAQDSKVFYQQSEKDLKTELSVTKLTERQHADLKAKALASVNPQSGGQFVAAIAQAPDSATIKELESMVEEQLNWSMLNDFSSQMNEIEKVKKGG
jgi:hypothetical protein